MTTATLSGVRPTAAPGTRATPLTTTDLAWTAVALLRDNGSPHNVELANWIESTLGGPVAPSVVDVPYAWQDGAVVDCTMGNWNGVPVSYTYQWQSDGVDIGGKSPTPSYTLAPDNVGKTFTCIVTASNATGEATSTSNAVVVA